MNEVKEVSGILVCSCGAKAEPKDEKRFRKRHPTLCNQKIKDREYNKKLAGGTRSVETLEEEDVHKYRIEVINATGRNLTAWEIAFMKSVTSQVEISGSQTLSGKQQKAIEDIYVNKTK